MKLKTFKFSMLCFCLLYLNCGESQEEKKFELQMKVDESIEFLSSKYKAINIDNCILYKTTLEYQKKLKGVNIICDYNCDDAFIKDSVKYVEFTPLSSIDGLQLWIKDVPLEENFNPYIYIAKVDSINQLPRIYATYLYMEKNSYRRYVESLIQDE